MSLPAYFTSLVSSTRQLSRHLSRDKADTLLLMAACMLVLMPHVLHLPVWASLTCAGVLGWRAWITVSGTRMPPRWMLIPISLLAMAGVYLTYKTFFGRDAGVTMLVLLLALKMLEMHARRDVFVVVMLGFFLMLTNFFYSQSIFTALMMGAAVIALLTAQLSFQYTVNVPPLRQRLRLGATIFGLAIPLMLVLFVLFPRVQGPLWGLPGDANSGRSGLSDSMSPGNISSLALSDEVAFRVQFIDPPPPQSQRYWRGVVLGYFDGRTWTTMTPQFNQKYTASFTALSPPIRHQVTLEPSDRRWLFALDMPQGAPLIPGNATFMRKDMQLLARQPVKERTRYDVASSVDYEAEKDIPPLLLQDWLELPPAVNPLTHAFAEKLRARSNSPEELVRMMLSYFRTEKFSYTLEPPPLGKDAVDDFLFTTRAGFCEHYSSAFVIMMRALDIPARVVTGYQGGEINPVDGIMTVRQADAHAWAEVWLKNRGWVRIDPTAAVAPERISQNLNSVIPRRSFGGLINVDFGKNSLFVQLNFQLSAIATAWNQLVLNYTPDKQKDMLRAIGFKDADLRTMIILMCTLGALAMAVVLLPMILQRRKSDPLDALYARFCRTMSRHGVARQLHEGPRAYRDRILSIQPSAIPVHKQAAIRQFLDLYEQLRYAPSGLAEQNAPSYTGGTIAALKSLMAHCR